MKKFFILIAILIGNISLVKAQTNKGNLLVGVSSTLSLAGTGSDLITLGYTTSKNKSDASGFEEREGSKVLSLNVLPKAGYFVADNFVVGLDAVLASSKRTEGENENEYRNTLWSVGPFARYYIPTETVIPFLEIGGTFGSSNDKAEIEGWHEEELEFKSSILGFGGGAGIAVLLGNNVTFDVMAGYNSLRVKEKENNPDNNRTVTGTIGLKVGITILLGSK